MEQAAKMEQEISTGGIAVYDPFRAKIAELKELNKNTIFLYDDPEGNKAARSHVFALRKSKGAIEATRKEAKAASLEYGRKVDAEARELTAEIEEMIAVHQKPLDEIEEREKLRLETIKGKMQAIVDCGNGLIGGQPQPFGLLIYELKERIVIDDSYGEFREEAQRLHAEATAKINTAFEEHRKREAEARELEQLRKEKQEREQKEEAERAEKLRLENEERLRKEGEERARKQEEDRKAEEARREADKQHRAAIHGEIIVALDKIGVPEDKAKEIIGAIWRGEIPHVKINY